jgi:hypothetical protein
VIVPVPPRHSHKRGVARNRFPADHRLTNDSLRSEGNLRRSDWLLTCNRRGPNTRSVTGKRRTALSHNSRPQKKRICGVTKRERRKWG